MNTPLHWAAQPLTACQHCTHRVGPLDAMRCSHALVANGHGTVTCESARARNGGCGPDANHLHWPAIELRPVRQPAAA